MSKSKMAPKIDLSEMCLFSARDAARLAGMDYAHLLHWLNAGVFKPSRGSEMFEYPFNHRYEDAEYVFNQRDIDRLRDLVEGLPKSDAPFADDGKQETFTVAEVAAMWNLSTDTVQRMFQDEPGVIALGNKNPRGKRRRVTLRIPRPVMERVKKRRSNA